MCLIAASLDSLDTIMPGHLLAVRASSGSGLLRDRRHERARVLLIGRGSQGGLSITSSIGLIVTHSFHD